LQSLPGHWLFWLIIPILQVNTSMLLHLTYCRFLSSSLQFIHYLIIRCYAPQLLRASQIGPQTAYLFNFVENHPFREVQSVLDGWRKDASIWRTSKFIEDTFLHSVPVGQTQYISVTRLSHSVTAQGHLFRA
jgi:hypothetical protein